ncbi:MAG: hypothetical protein QXO75_06460 [Nitrososphaerota archaeon]
MSTKPEINIKVTANTQQAQSALKDLGEEAKSMGNKFQEGAQRTRASLTEVVTSTTNVANSFMALYNLYDMVHDRQLALDRANLRLSRSQDTLREAQEAYNKAVAEFGLGSQKAQEAYKHLQDAQEQVRINQETVAARQNDLNKAYVMAATTSIPQLVTAIGNLRSAYQTLASATAGASVALSGLSASVGILGGAIVVGGLQIAGFASSLSSLAEQFQAGQISTSRFSATLMFMLGPVGQVVEGIRWLLEQIGLIPQGMGTAADLWVSAWNSITSTVSNAVGTISSLVRGMIDDIQNAISSLFGSLSSIPSYGFGGLGGGFNIPNIPGYAEGALVTKPTIALVGEKGPELIVPVDPNREVGFLDLGGIWEGITSGFQWITNTISSAISGVTNWISSGISYAYESVSSFVSGVSSAVSSFFGGGAGFTVPRQPEVYSMFAYQPTYPEEYWGAEYWGGVSYPWERGILPTFMVAPEQPEVWGMFTTQRDEARRRRAGGGGGGFYEEPKPILNTINPFIEINFKDVSIDPGTYARFKRELAYTISRAICDAVQERRNL